MVEKSKDWLEEFFKRRTLPRAILKILENYWEQNSY